MKKIISLFVVIASVLFLCSCNKISVEQSGKEIIKEYEVKDNINELEIKDITLKYDNLTTGAKVHLKSGDKKSISIKMQESMQSEISLNHSSSKLSIYGKEFVTYKTNVSFEITITGYVFSKIDFQNAVICDVDNKTIEGTKLELKLSGASQLKGNELSTTDFDLDSSGASMFSFNKVDCDNATIDLSGASSFTISNFKIKNKLDLDSSGASMTKISGSSSKSEIDLSGASIFKDKNYVCDILDLSLSGASQMEIAVNNEINGNVSGASTVNYFGNPKVNVSTSGGSVVKAI